MKRCVITGLGVICSIGKNLDEVWRNALQGQCGIREIKSFNTEGCSSEFGAEVESFEPTFNVSDKYFKRMDRVSLLCIEAATEAVKNANLGSKVKDMGIVIGSCTGGAISAEKFQRQLLNNVKRPYRSAIFGIPINAIAGNVAWYFGATGPVANIANACAAGTMSIIYACNLIERGLVDIVLAGGSDTMAALPFSGFNSLQALDGRPCSPLSRSKGISLGEGAGAVIVESLEHALKRNATIYCEVVGSGITSDAYHITAPRSDGEGQIEAIQLALADANINSSKIDYLNAHGTGTPLNDSAEKTSLEKVFYNDSDRIKISSSKSMIGHCLGAAGAIEAVISIMALQKNEIPPTIHFEAEAAASKFNFVPNQKQSKKLDYVMSNSFAFGGNNASIIFSKNDNHLPTDIHKNRPKQRIYITGMGILSPIGMGISEYWSGVLNKQSGIEPVSYENTNYRSKFAARLNIPNPTAYGISPAALRKLDRISTLLILSGISSLKDANITINPDNEKEIGTIVGTSDGPATEIANFQKGMIQKGIHSGSPFIFPNTVYNAAGGYLSIFTKCKGHTITFANGFNTGLFGVCYGYDLLKTNKQKTIIASGVDEYSEIHHLLYDYLNALDGTAQEYSRPYSFQKGGFILGEGSTSLILETEEQATRRGANLYAEILGYGFSNVPLGPGKIDGEGYGLDMAIKRACDTAMINLEEIDAIVGFANGHSAIDMMEIKSYHRVFGDRLTSIPIYTIKSFVGEGRAATSALQLAHAALILAKQENPETRAAYVPKFNMNNREISLTEKPPKQTRKILVNSFSYGGAYISAVLARI